MAPPMPPHEAIQIHSTIEQPTQEHQSLAQWEHELRCKHFRNVKAYYAIWLSILPPPNKFQDETKLKWAHARALTLFRSWLSVSYQNLIKALSGLTFNYSALTSLGVTSIPEKLGVACEAYLDFFRDEKSYEELSSVLAEIGLGKGGEKDAFQEYMRGLEI